MYKEKSQLFIELNHLKYTQEECTTLEENSPNKIDVKASLGQWPSAYGWDAIIMCLVVPLSLFIVSGISSGFLNELGKDLYTQSKKLLKITEDKEGFEESKYKRRI